MAVLRNHWPRAACLSGLRLEPCSGHQLPEALSACLEGVPPTAFRLSSWSSRPGLDACEMESGAPYQLFFLSFHANLFLWVFSNSSRVSFQTGDIIIKSGTSLWATELARLQASLSSGLVWYLVWVRIPGDLAKCAHWENCSSTPLLSIAAQCRQLHCPLCT